MDYGFVKVASAVPVVKVGNCRANAGNIVSLIHEAASRGVEVVCFPELCITAYTCQDLFESTLLADEALAALDTILQETIELNIISIVGIPLVVDGFLANCAVALQKGKILGVVPKTYLPNYKEFYEKRWFASADELRSSCITLCRQTVPIGTDLLFDMQGAVFGIEICEDLWAPIPKSSQTALAGADIVFNLSADNECTGKNDYVKSLVSTHSAQTISGYVFTSCGFGESTQDVVFAGNSYICENGRILAEGRRFEFSPQLTASEIDVELLRHERRINTTFRHCATRCNRQNSFRIIPVQPGSSAFPARLSRCIPQHPFIPSQEDYNARCRDIINIQAAGLAKRLNHIHAKSAVIGISGGLDSTLALLVTAKAFDMLNCDRKQIVGVTMPGLGTSAHTHTNSLNLMHELDITIREIPISEACALHFKDIGHNPNVYDITFENSQARERTQILMDVANQTGGIVVGTGDLSELALGWATYNGDHMSMYGVNCSIPKTLVRHLIKWFADNTADDRQRETLQSIVNTPISPELIPTDENGDIAQKTEDKVGPYELHDFFLYYTLRYGFRPAKIFYLAIQAFVDIENPAYSKQDIIHWIKTFYHRFFQQQFKRSCLPDGPKVGSCSLSPRGDWRMPSDADAAAWENECNRLQ